MIRFGNVHPFTVLRYSVCGFLLFFLYYMLLYDDIVYIDPDEPTDAEIWCQSGNVYKAHVPFDRITLILHVSANYFSSSSMSEQIENWNAPVSLTVVIDDLQQQYDCIHEELRQMIKKHNFTQLNVHYLYKKADGRCRLPKPTTKSPAEFSACTEKSHPDLITVAKYPMNLARNTARMFAKTKFIILSDADLYHSQNFERRMRQAAEREITKDPMKVLVYRIFEIEDDITSLPRTKADMKVLIESGKAVTFHYHCSGMHEIAGREKWLAKEENFENTTIAIQNIPYTRFTWEPRFVSLPNIPFHDENFPYRVRANNVLHWEMCRAGYKFALVDDLYVFHRGIRKDSQGIARDNIMVQRMNQKRYEKALSLFHDRMSREYPQTEGTCPALLKRTLFFFTVE